MARYYSCDSHVLEPRTIFEGLEDRFGSRAPYFEHTPKGEYLRLPGAPPVNIGRLGISGARLDDPATQERMLSGYAGVNPGCLDATARLADQDRDGIAGEVMYPSANMWTYAVPERDLVHELFRRHNDWAIDWTSDAPERLVAVGCLPLPDVDEACAELERASAKGMRGFAIPVTVPDNKPYSHPDYDRFWAMASDLGVPLTMHCFTGHDWQMGLPSTWGLPTVAITGYTLAHAAVSSTVATLITDGVAHRFPGVQWIIGEFETGWVAHFKQRLDHATYRARDLAFPGLDREPSEYFDRQFSVTFEDDIQGIVTRDWIGVDNMMWGNDYPHHDSIFPNSVRVLGEIMHGVPEEEIIKMTWSNVIDLYGIDVTKLQADDEVLTLS